MVTRHGDARRNHLSKVNAQTSTLMNIQSRLAMLHLYTNSVDKTRAITMPRDREVILSVQRRAMKIPARKRSDGAMVHVDNLQTLKVKMKIGYEAQALELNQDLDGDNLKTAEVARNQASSLRAAQPEITTAELARVEECQQSIMKHGTRRR